VATAKEPVEGIESSPVRVILGRETHVPDDPGEVIRVLQDFADQCFFNRDAFRLVLFDVECRRRQIERCSKVTCPITIMDVGDDDLT